MRTDIENLLKAIELMKPDVPLTAILDVEMADLEALYSEIRKLRKQVEIQRGEIEGWKNNMLKYQAKVELLNDLAKANNKRYRLTDYM